MNIQMIGELSSLGELVVRVINNHRDSGAYPVLGAEGDQFFVEISSGAMESRIIHNTLYINFEFIAGSGNTDGLAVSPEMNINLPDASYLVALLSLLSAALGNEAKILHPLDPLGNYLVGWQQTLTTVSEKPS